MKKTLPVALTACLVLSIAGVAAAETSDSSDLKLDGSVHVEYRADKNSNSIYPGASDATHDGLKTTFFLNADKKIADNLDFYARLVNRSASTNLGKNYAADYMDSDNRTNITTIDQLGLKYKNAGWNYKLGSQNLSLGATGLLYDDTRYAGQHILTNALTTTGKVGVIDLKTAIAKTNYQSGTENDNLYYIHGGYSADKSTYGFGYARANYGSTSAKKAANNSGLNYYTADFSYKLTNDLHFSSEFTQSSAKEQNKGINLVLFHMFNKNTNGGVAYFKVEEQGNIQNANEGGMTYQWGNAEGYGVFFNHKLSKNVTFNLADFQMSPINRNLATHNSGMPETQNTLRIGATYNF